MRLFSTLRLSAVVARCGLVLLLAACAGTPLRTPVAFDLPEAWRAPLRHDGSKVALANVWKAFHDPVLVIKQARSLRLVRMASSTALGAAA
jgi:hypothetical protein